MEKVSRFLSARAGASRGRRQSDNPHHPDAEAVEQLTRDLARTRQFAAMVAHEMRNLMAPLVYGAELLGRTDDRKITLRVRHDILISVANLRRLVDDLLSASGCEKGRMTLVKSLVDLRDVVNTSVELVRPMFPTLGDHLDVAIERDQPVFVNGDFCRLSQVISNLVINAAKFTPTDGDIRVALRSNGKSATITVKDSGVGIEPAELSRIFEAFSQGTEESADTGHGGLGLGLAIARELVEMHGGELTVYSAGKGAGSEFVVRLPTVQPS
jgi:signal transduction histidine kinase